MQTIPLWKSKWKYFKLKKQILCIVKFTIQDRVKLYEGLTKSNKKRRGLQNSSQDNFSVGLLPSIYFVKYFVQFERFTVFYLWLALKHYLTLAYEFYSNDPIRPLTVIMWIYLLDRGGRDPL